MSEHATTTLAYVRTAGGVVKVGAGERVPDDALPSEVDRLRAAGVVVEVHPDPTPGSGAPIGDVPPPARSRNRNRGSSRRESGSSDPETIES